MSETYEFKPTETDPAAPPVTIVFDDEQQVHVVIHNIALPPMPIAYLYYLNAAFTQLLEEAVRDYANRTEGLRYEEPKQGVPAG